MNKNRVLKILIPIQFILLVNQVITGIFHESIPGRLYSLIHMDAGIVLGALLLVHLILNWDWVTKSYFKKKPAAEPVAEKPTERTEQ